MAAAASSSARAFLQLLRPRQHQLPSLHLTSAATAPAGVAAAVAARRSYFFLLLQRQPHRSWAVVRGGAAPSPTGSGGCDEEESYSYPQAPPQGAPPLDLEFEEGEVVADCGGEQAACGGKGAVSPDAQQAAERRRSSSSSTYTPKGGATPWPRNRSAMPRGKGARARPAGPAPPGGGPVEGSGGRGGSHH